LKILDPSLKRDQMMKILNQMLQRLNVNLLEGFQTVVRIRCLLSLTRLRNQEIRKISSLWNLILT